MDPFIQEFKQTLSQELCLNIIDRYEKEYNKYDGVTSGGLNKNVKDTVDYKISLNTDSELWKDIDIELYGVLQKYLGEYVKTIDKTFFPEGNHKFSHSTILSENGFQLQRYKKCVGKFTYHNDFSIDYSRLRHRTIVYIWYLNDVSEGGETEFLGGKYAIKPEAGKLVFFPALWTYPHSGKTPISNDKYIITGWFYTEDSNKVMTEIHKQMSENSPRIEDSYIVLNDSIHKDDSTNDKDKIEIEPT